MPVSPNRTTKALAEALREAEVVAPEDVRRVHRLLREGGGEEPLLEILRALAPQSKADLAAVARACLKVGVRPKGGYRRRTMEHDRCTICEREVSFCWGCRCGFRICQPCLEANRWGITCNNITWECPDCGGMRSF